MKTEMTESMTQTETITHTTPTAPLLAGSIAFATAQQKFVALLEKFLAQIQIELVAVEIINQREKTLRLYIDDPKNGIGIEDCVRVTQALDEPLETDSEASVLLQAIFGGPYELEVSSPGIERPLQKLADFDRFSGSIARIHTFRALTADEAAASGAEAYCAKNPKQKNFYGILRGVLSGANGQNVIFGTVPEDGTLKQNLSAKPNSKSNPRKKQEIDLSKPLKNETRLIIPKALIAKANLEPNVEWPEPAVNHEHAMKEPL